MPGCEGERFHRANSWPAFDVNRQRMHYSPHQLAYFAHKSARARGPARQAAAALCKLEGFTYAPSPDLYWQHGHSTESDFICVTTQSLNAEQLQALSEEVGPQRTLLACCGAFRGDAGRWSNLTVKKIPKMVLQKCEWGHDDYSLNVENLPQAPKPVPPSTAQGSLFGADDSGAAP